MKTQSKLLLSVLCMLMMALCVVSMASCSIANFMPKKECVHEWGEWNATEDATCTEEGVKTRNCTKCSESETSPIEALGHDWEQASCTSPQTCKSCGEVIGTTASHSYVVEEIKDNALKSAADCVSAAQYYKSCVCGEISANDADVFTSGEALGHKDENKDHTCDRGCVGAVGEHVDADKNHACDYGCSETIGACVDENTDHACDYGCDKSIGVCEDANTDHACDYGCAKPFGACADAQEDEDHECDYGCGEVLENCFDTENDGDHVCDICGALDITAHDYDEATCSAPATCIECGLTTGTTLAHVDENYDHVCDNGCGKNDMGEHGDSDIDSDHLCDYGCGASFGSCYDAEEDADHACDICGKVGVSAHTYVEDVNLATDATCDTAATKTYTCNCGDEYTEDYGDALGHNITGVTPTEIHVSGCEYVEIYVCIACEEEVAGATVYHHSYVASISVPATCAADGEKTFKCSVCEDDSKPAEIIEKDATGHNWVNGDVVNGVRVDTCSVCSGTKTVTVYEGTSTDEINAGDLADKEIELNNANISLDNGVIDAIGDQNVTVSADKLEGDDRTDLGLSEDQLAQVGDSPIYNFTINNGSENISNFGEDNFVTITLPYTLSDGEDVDSIAIWFINDEGEVESKIGRASCRERVSLCV